MSPSVVQSTPMDVVVTVPAIWSNSAKQETEKAASLAGFGGEKEIKLISEPVGINKDRKSATTLTVCRKRQHYTLSNT